MEHLLRDRRLSFLALTAACASLPAAVIHFFGTGTYYPPSWVHFGFIAIGASVAAAAALALTIAGARRGDGRTVLLGTAFTVMTALLAVHGFATPGILVGRDRRDLGGRRRGAPGGRRRARAVCAALPAPPAGGSPLARPAGRAGRRRGRVRPDRPPCSRGVSRRAGGGQPRGDRSADRRTPVLRMAGRAGRPYVRPHAARCRPARRHGHRVARGGARAAADDELRRDRLVGRARVGADRRRAGRRARGVRPVALGAVPAAGRRSTGGRAGRGRGGLPRSTHPRADGEARGERRLYRGPHTSGGAARRPCWRRARVVPGQTSQPRDRRSAP